MSKPCIHEAKEVVDKNKANNLEAGRKEASRAGIKSSAEKQQVKIYQSLLNHWKGLTLFVLRRKCPWGMDNPEVPLDNNIAENSI